MITILGASGFIGSHLAKRLQQYKLGFQAVKRNEPVPDGNLGDVIYCIGVTADFRSRSFETVDAHVCTLLDFVRRHEFESLLYLSSTRLYSGSDSTAEDAPLRARSQSANDLYNLSKLMGESITLNCGRTGRVARIANVYGADFTSDNFLPSILRQAASRRKIVFETAPDSEKDYVWIHEVVENLIWIAAQGKQPIYNVASGMNVSNAQLAARLHELTGCEIEFAPGAPSIRYPRIDIGRVRGEFGIVPSSVLDDLDWLLQSYKNDQH